MRVVDDGFNIGRQSLEVISKTVFVLRLNQYSTNYRNSFVVEYWTTVDDKVLNVGYRRVFAASAVI